MPIIGTCPHTSCGSGFRAGALDQIASAARAQHFCDAAVKQRPHVPPPQCVPVEGDRTAYVGYVDVQEEVHVGHLSQSG